MNISLNAELNSLILKHKLQRNGEKYLNSILATIKQLLQELCQDKKVAIRGAGEHTQMLLDVLQDTINIVGIYANNIEVSHELKMGNHTYPAYPTAKLADSDAEIVIISSFMHRAVIQEELLQLEKSFQIINIYVELEKKGIVLTGAFYFNTEQMYESVIFDKKQYESAVNERDKERYLMNTILSYLSIRDFINALKYIDTYIQLQYAKKNALISFKEELIQFLGNIREKLSQRNHRDILIVWVDQLGYNEMDICPFLNDESRESLFFEQAFTSAPFTYPTFWAMFEKKYSIDDKVYHTSQRPVGRDNPVIRMLKDKGYGFKYVGDGATSKLLEEPYRIGYPSYENSCVRCFQTLEEILNAERPMCIMLHSLVETHIPYLSGELKNAEWFDWPFTGKDINTVKEQIKASADYLGRQLQYYTGFLGENTVKIYLSDHGKRYVAEATFTEALTHIFLFVKDTRLSKMRETRLFGLINMYELLDYLSDEDPQDDKYNNIFSEFIKQQEVGIFNATAIDYYMQQNARESAMPFRAARGIDDRYVILNTGKEYYYRLPDEEKNEIDNPRYQKRIQVLKEFAGDYFYDFEKYCTELTMFRRLYEQH